MDADQLSEILRPHLAGALVATDFDGTLAPLVTDPDASRMVDGGLDALTRLARCGAQVAVITGRDVLTVRRLGGLDSVPGLVVAGIYGAQIWRDGTLNAPAVPDSVQRLRARLPEVLDDADPAIWVEDKQLSLVVHARRADDPVAALAAVAPGIESLAGELGLETHPGSGILEVRLPGYDKGAVFRTFAQGRTAALFLGDDFGDVPALRAARDLRTAGAIAYGVGVASSGVREVVEAADVVVPDAVAVVDLLGRIAAT